MTNEEKEQHKIDQTFLKRKQEKNNQEWKKNKKQYMKNNARNKQLT